MQDSPEATARGVHGTSSAAWWRDRAPWQALSLGTTGVVLLVMYLVQPYRWYTGDIRNQYVPVFRDIGNRLLAGEFPAIDPNLGPSGNYTLDIQYGLYDPVHWLTSIMVSRTDSLAWASFLMVLVFSCLLALGTTCLSLRVGAPGWWAVVAGVAAATSGYAAFYLATEWIPGVLSLAWVPWVWWAALGRVSVRRAVAIACCTFLVVAGGWPSTWLTLGAVGVGVAVEAVVARDRDAGTLGWLGPLAVKGGASAGGLLVALIGAVPLLRAQDWTVRRTGVEWNDFLVPHLLDVANHIAPRTSVPLETFGTADVEVAPVFFFGWFVTTLLWLVPWGRALWHRPGVVSGVVGSVLALASTQLPGQLGPLRDPIRQLAGFQVVTIVAVVALVAGGVVVTRARLLGVASTAAALLVVGLVRDTEPARDVPWTALSLVAVAVLVTLVARTGFGSWATGATAWATTVLLFAVAWACVPVRKDVSRGPTRVEAGPIAVTDRDQPVFVAYGRAPSLTLQRWFRQGIGRGFQRLTPDNRPIPGYSSVGSDGFRDVFRTQASHGYSRPRTIKRLFRRERSTGRLWYELLGLRTVVVERSLWDAWDRRVEGPWGETGRTRDFRVFRRAGPATVAGRVTHTSPGVRVTPRTVSRGSQTYDVAAPRGGRLVFRDIYWPGYVAMLDGRRVAVRSLRDTLVSVRLPPGSHGVLRLVWHPQRLPSWLGLGGGGVLLVVTSAAGAGVLRRRRAGTERGRLN